jgi:RNA polymerase sigma-B factor
MAGTATLRTRTVGVHPTGRTRAGFDKVQSGKSPGLRGWGPPGSFDQARRQELKALFDEYRRTLDPGLRNELVIAHLGLGASVARRFVGRGEPLDDLMQVAFLALCHAVERFDPSRGVAFTTFGTVTVAGELKKHFRDKTWALRVSRRLKDLSADLARATDDLSHDIGRAPTLAELARHLDVTPDAVVQAQQARQDYWPLSLDAPLPGNEDAEALGLTVGSEDPEFRDAEVRADLSELLADLPRRQALIVHLRFFEGLGQREIGARFGISEMQVSRLMSRSLDQLRQVTRHADARDDEAMSS